MDLVQLKYHFMQGIYEFMWGLKNELPMKKHTLHSSNFVILYIVFFFQFVFSKSVTSFKLA